MRSIKNLNSLFDDSENRCVVRCTKMCEYAFDDIINHVIRWLSDSRCCHVAMMCPYSKDRDILTILGLKESCTLITTKDKWLKNSYDYYRLWNPYSEYVLYTLQNGRGYKKNILHSKIIVLMDNNRVPYGVITGSSNFSGGTSSNIEHVMYIKDKHIAQEYLAEFNRVVSISSPVKGIC